MTALEPIAGKDRIELASVLGWKCIVRKGSVAINDLVLFTEPDSLVPSDLPEFSFLKDKRDVNGKPFARVSRMKMGGVWSEGLVTPLAESGLEGDLVEGYDATFLIGAVPFERRKRGSNGPNRTVGVKISTFPNFLPRTDEVRGQSAPALLHAMKGQYCFITRKMDGMSMTIYRTRAEGQLLRDESPPLHVCSRNQELTAGDNTPYHRVLRERSIDLPPGFAVQGELVGPGCNGNPMNLAELNFMAFTVFYETQLGAWEELPMVAVSDFIEAMGIELVPELFRGALDDVSLDSLDALLKLAEEQGPDCEGIVVRAMLPQHTDRYRRLSFKVINPSYGVHDGDN